MFLSKLSCLLQEQWKSSCLISAYPESLICQVVWNVSFYFPSTAFRVYMYDSVCNNNWNFLLLLINFWEMCDSSASFFHAKITWMHVWNVTNFKRQIKQHLQLPAWSRIQTFLFFVFDFWKNISLFPFAVWIHIKQG